MRTIPFAFSAILPCLYTHAGVEPCQLVLAAMFADSAFDGLCAALYLLRVTGVRNPWIGEEYAHGLFVV